MTNLQCQLTLKNGISLAFGSIIGSGILFLPSLTYSLSGAYTLWVWIITTILCIPFIYIFTDMVKKVPNERGAEGFVSLGLGKQVGATIPLIFLGTVSLGMPASALIVGEYVRNLVGGGLYIQIIVTIIIVGNGVIVNLNVAKTGANIQLVATFMILLVSLLLLIFAFPSKFGQESLSISSNLHSKLYQESL